MTDLNELERLLRDATAGPCFQDAPYAVQKTMHAIDEDEFKLFCALRDHAPELIRDARRMEWAATNLVDVTVICGTDLVQKVWCLDSKSGPSVEGATLREAIDAAIAQEQK